MTDLRIVGGRLRGRRFSGPAGKGTRPTADRVREAIGSILQSRDALVDAYVLDLFAGTGALAFEALSRGAAHAVLVERQQASLRGMQQSAVNLGLEAQTTLVRLDLLEGTSDRTAAALSRALERPVDVLFADAPYALVAQVPPLITALAKADLLADGALAVVEHERHRAPTLPEGFTSLGAYGYGATGVLLWIWDDPRKDPL